MLSTLLAFGLGVVSSILGNFIYDKFFKQQRGYSALIETPLKSGKQKPLDEAPPPHEGFLFR